MDRLYFNGVASADQSDLSGSPVTLSSAKLAVNTSATTINIGVLDTEADAASRPCSCVTQGRTEGLVGAGNWSAELVLLGGGTGGLIELSTKGNYYIALALGTGTDDDKHDVLVRPGRVGTYA